MISIKDGKLQPELLDGTGVLKEKSIQEYNYIEMKNDLEEVIDIMATNKLIHALYEEALSYDISEDLEFNIYIFSNIRNDAIVINSKTDPYMSDTNTSVITLNRSNYDKSIELCMNLLQRFKMSYDRLNEVEKYIIKSLEFDDPKLTDEELMFRLLKYKNKYYDYKRSAYIKMALQLNIKKVKNLENDTLIREALMDNCIVTISN